MKASLVWALVVALAFLGGFYFVLHLGGGRIAGLASASATSTVATTSTTTVGVQGGAGTLASAQQASQGSSGGVALTQHTYTINDKAIPLGDGHISSAPKVGYVYSCTTSFQGGGASHAGDWIGTSTWDLTKKISVEGKVSWPSATFSMRVSGGTRFITGNGLPVGETTGMFPIQPSDPAYQYDRNPNHIQAQRISYSLPADPAFASSPSCLPMGPIGIALDGVAIYNALDDGGRDAVAHEIQDSCNGHPQSAGQYHYHGPSPCMPNYNKNDTVVGYALDGFPITSMFNLQGVEYTDANLDACHGTTGEYYDENGKLVSGYHYVLTEEYPYTLGCFMGTPELTRPAGGSNGSPNQTHATSGNTQSGPPQAAIAACSGKASGASCTLPAGGTGTCTNTPGGSFACVPN